MMAAASAVTAETTVILARPRRHMIRTRLTPDEGFVVDMFRGQTKNVCFQFDQKSYKKRYLPIQNLKPLLEAFQVRSRKIQCDRLPTHHFARIMSK